MKRKLTTLLPTLFATTGASRSTAHDSASYAPGKLESNSSAVDAMDVEQGDGEFLLVDHSRTNTSSSTSFSTPSAGTTVDSSAGLSSSSAGNTMDVDKVGDAADQGPVAFTLPVAPGTHESTPRAMEALSTEAASEDDELIINDEGARLSVARVDIDVDQITAARQIVEKLDTRTESTDDAEVQLQRLLNSVEPTTTETSGECPCIAEEQVCRAHVRGEENYVRQEIMGDVMKAIMRLDALDVFANQQMCESGDAPPNEQLVSILKRKIDLTIGIWSDAPDIVEWPNGVAGIQMCAEAGRNEGLANRLDVFANLAEVVLISMTGRVRYKLGLPLMYDAIRFTSHDVTGLSVAKGCFFLPRTAIPFLYDVLRIPWCNANNEYTEAAIVRGAATNRDITTDARRQPCLHTM
jgi:hypothetical protein